MRYFKPDTLGLSCLITLLSLSVFNLTACSPAPPSGMGKAGAPKAGGAMPPMPVQLATVSKQVATESSIYLGKVTSRHSIDLHAQVESRLQQVLVQPGQYVKAGQTLFILESAPQKAIADSLMAGADVARQQFTVAQTDLTALYNDREALQAEKVYLETEEARMKSLGGTGSVSDKEVNLAESQAKQVRAKLDAIDKRMQGLKARQNQAKAQVSQNSLNAKSASAQLNYYVIKAPFAGQLGEVWGKQGDFIKKDDTLANLTAPSELELDLAIPAEEAMKLKTGLTIELLGKEAKVLGRSSLFFVSPTVESVSQTVQAKARLNLPSLQLRNQQQLQTRLLWQEAEGLFVPTAAVVRKQGKPMVYLVEPAAASEVKLPPGMPPLPGPVYKTRLQPVVLGAIQGQFYQINSGLEAGQKVVSAGVMKLQQPGAQVFEEPSMP
jgi:multidrug efflux pump subunit AcrA (membrane-fusion protein)